MNSISTSVNRAEPTHFEICQIDEVTPAPHRSQCLEGKSLLNQSQNRFEVKENRGSESFQIWLRLRLVTLKNGRFKITQISRELKLLIVVVTLVGTSKR